MRHKGYKGFRVEERRMLELLSWEVRLVGKRTHPYGLTLAVFYDADARDLFCSTLVAQGYKDKTGICLITGQSLEKG